MNLTYTKDLNGNTRIKYACAAGGFTVCTNGNLPRIHNMRGTGISKSNYGAALIELHRHVQQFGTQRQVNLMHFDVAPNVAKYRR
jgi:hypothetical protein